MIFRTK